MSLAVVQGASQQLAEHRDMSQNSDEAMALMASVWTGDTESPVCGDHQGEAETAIVLPETQREEVAASWPEMPVPEAGACHSAPEAANEGEAGASAFDRESGHPVSEAHMAGTGDTVEIQAGVSHGLPVAERFLLLPMPEPLEEPERSSMAHTSHRLDMQRRASLPWLLGSSVERELQQQEGQRPRFALRRGRMPSHRQVTPGTLGEEADDEELDGKEEEEWEEAMDKELSEVEEITIRNLWVNLSVPDHFQDTHADPQEGSSCPTSMGMDATGEGTSQQLVEYQDMTQILKETARTISEEVLIMSLAVVQGASQQLAEHRDMSQNSDEAMALMASVWTGDTESPVCGDHQGEAETAIVLPETQREEVAASWPEMPVPEAGACHSAPEAANEGEAGASAFDRESGHPVSEAHMAGTGDTVEIQAGVSHGLPVAERFLLLPMPEPLEEPERSSMAHTSHRLDMQRRASLPWLLGSSVERELQQQEGQRPRFALRRGRMPSHRQVTPGTLGEEADDEELDGKEEEEWEEAMDKELSEVEEITIRNLWVNLSVPDHFQDTHADPQEGSSCPTSMGMDATGEGTSQQLVEYQDMTQILKETARTISEEVLIMSLAVVQGASQQLAEHRDMSQNSDEAMALMASVWTGDTESPVCGDHQGEAETAIVLPETQREEVAASWPEMPVPEAGACHSAPEAANEGEAGASAFDRESGHPVSEAHMAGTGDTVEIQAGVSHGLPVAERFLLLPMPEPLEEPERSSMAHTSHRLDMQRRASLPWLLGSSVERELQQQEGQRPRFALRRGRMPSHRQVTPGTLGEEADDEELDGKEEEEWEEAMDKELSEVEEITIRNLWVNLSVPDHFQDTHADPQEGSSCPTSMGMDATGEGTSQQLVEYQDMTQILSNKE
ncbi:uncharacterized protein LOC133276737 [Pezoporus flaviventris]|uniref:uncharacterized protein LOC133276734 n=1 Tax=Pezoporus flaviventris TaxID=889875 RepID=UPI002AB00DC6|nr:uncharacterized protein LOC133276734 [Pezoporus flaviventris]XP_061323858.1 uncharacterized protein LOC133276737 [Pezoporus flaviventris]